MKTNDLIAEVISLPVEERALIVDMVLKSLNPVQAEIDAQWAALALRRLQAVQDGSVQPVSGDEVFQKVWQRFSK